MLLASFVLGILNVLAMGMAMRDWKLIAAWTYLLIQVPWTFYNIHTHQYGFFVISAVSLCTSLPVILKRSR